jgi:hypothetical protein
VGYSVFHFQPAGSSGAATTIAANVHSFFSTLVGVLPDDVHITFDAEVLDLSETGVLTAVWPVTPPAQVQGTSAAVYARPVGARVDWSTGHVVAGHRLVGRTFIVPLASTSFDTTGQLLASVAQSINDQATIFITSTAGNRPLVVWSRTHSVSWAVDRSSVPLLAAVLRGRRD